MDERNKVRAQFREKFIHSTSIRVLTDEIHGKLKKTDFDRLEFLICQSVDHK